MSFHNVQQANKHPQVVAWDEFELLGCTEGSLWSTAFKDCGSHSMLALVLSLIDGLALVTNTFPWWKWGSYCACPIESVQSRKRNGP